jgi:RNA polymerase sigma factor (sigma-70 family)
VGIETGGTGSEVGERLAAHAARLRLLLTYLAGRAVRARVELDDLVQEVFLRALSAPSGLPPRSEGGSAEAGDAALWRFLVRLARNSVIDAARSIRAAKRDGKTLPLAHGDWSRVGPRESQILAKTAGPVTRASLAETSERVRARFESLSSEHRRVIGLRQFEGLSARAAGVRLGRSETAVHSLFRRALAAWEEGLDETAGSRDESGGA